jgi:hypothetical protein
MLKKFFYACSWFNFKKCRPSVLAKHWQLNNVLAAYCHQLDANFFQLVANHMQTIGNLGTLYCMAASRMQFASDWWPTE